MPVSPGSPPPYATRLREARERAGLTLQELSERTGLSYDRLFDVESYDDELWSTMSVADVAALAGALALSPRELVAPDGEAAGLGVLAPQDLVRSIREHLDRRGMELASFEAEVGWEVGGVMTDPKSAWSA